MARAAPDDPKGLIREAYRLQGLGEAEARTIFLDWVLSLPAGADPRALIPGHLERHGAAGEAHPMTKVLREGLGTASPRRRGGAGGRRGAEG